MVIKLIALVCEISIFLKVLSLLLNHKQKYFVGLCFIYLIDIVIMMTTYLQLVSYKIQMIVYFFLVLYLWLEYRIHPLSDVIYSLFLSIFLVCGFQLLVYFGLFKLPVGELRGDVAIIGGSFLTMLFVKNSSLFLRIKNMKHTQIGQLLIVGCIIFTIAVILIRIVPAFSLFEATLILAIFIITILFLWLWKREHEIALAMKKEKALLQLCNASFEELIQDVRCRQHDFDNHLDAIGGLAYSCHSYDELVKGIEQCLQYTYRDNNFNNLLTLQGSPMLKGFLYCIFQKAAKNNFEITYHIYLKEESTLELDFVIQEIIGILFDNAKEAQLEKMQKKVIEVDINQKEEKISIKVQNPADYIPFSQIKKYLRKGYSTKGNNRGYGLYSITNTIKKYKGNMNISNIERGKQNWVSVEVTIPLL